MSIVRDNLMNRPGYTPYCGVDLCMSRTTYRRGQFECRCGWRSKFEPDFIARYEARWTDAPPQPGVTHGDASQDGGAGR